MKSTLDRRTFIRLTASASGALVVGLSLQSCGPEKLPATVHEFSPLIKIDTDGWITLIAKNPEIGQGIKTALPMILAEELGADWKKVKVVQGDYDTIYEEQWAGGSYAIILNWDLMRTAGAKVRYALIQAASKKMNYPVAELTTRNSRVLHAKSGDAIPFEELIAEASEIALPETIEFKPIEAFEIVGKSIPQVDLDQMLSGATKYSIDLKLPEMVYATVLKNPVFEGGVDSWDDSQAKSVNGVIDIIELDNKAYGGRLIGPNSPNFVNGIAVIANSTWAAFKGAEKLKVVWDNTGCRKENTEGILKRFHSQLTNTSIERKDGNIDAAKRGAASNVEAVYELPFLAHATMEPMNCTVDYRDDLCEVWAPTQNPEALQD